MMGNINNNLRRRLRALLQPSTVLGGAMIALVWAGIAVHLNGEEKDIVGAAKQNADNLTRVFAVHVVRVVDDADRVLLSLRAEYAKDPQHFDIENAQVYLSDLILQLSVIGPDGVLKAATIEPSSGLRVDLSDRDHYRAHVNADKDDLFISKPVLGRNSGRTSIQLSWRISNPDGLFGGVIVASIDQSRLAHFYDSIDIGKDGNIAVLGLDGTLRAARGFQNGEPNGSFRGSLLFKKLQESPIGFFYSPGAVDGIRRLVFYRKIETFPLIVAVGLAQHEVFSTYWRERTQYFVAAAALTVVILLIVGFGARRERKLIETSFQKQQAEENLAHSQERYRLVGCAVNDGVWDWNILTDEDYMSPRWKAILGYADDEIPNVRSSFWNLLHPDDKAAVVEATRAHLEERNPYALDFRLRCKNGDYRWVHSRGQASYDAANRPVRMIGAVTDITERKRTEEALAQSQERYRSIESAVNDGIYDQNLLTGETYLSRRWKGILGYADDEIANLESAFLDLVHPDDRAAIAEMAGEYLKSKENKSHTLDFRLRHKNGDYRWVHSRGMAFYDENGPIRVLGAITDITDRKRAEEELARANRELEARVAERTAELAREMRQREAAQMTLAQAQKMEAVGQLTAGIAHDFNNLLAVIQGGLEFVEGAAARGVTAEPELIDAARRATRRGRELVQRLLAFARQSPLQAEPTAIDRLVLDTLRLLQRTLGEGIDIETRLDATTAAAFVDRNQLANVLLNLALNARDAMPDGGQLTIATKCRPARSAAAEGSAQWSTGEEICIAVSDTGLGMAEEVRRRVFEPFFTTKPDGLGNGLGLSMVFGFVEQSGGHIEVDSAVGHGTTITIHLPRIAVLDQTTEPDAVASSAVTAQKKNVLLVEDDPDVRIVMAAQLKQLGYTVHAVANGMEAIHLIQLPTRIDIILTDIVLPGGIDGVRLAKEAMRARPTMGVLCMSGYDPTHKHRKWLEVQNIEFLEKPFSRARLAQALEATLPA